MAEKSVVVVGSGAAALVAALTAAVGGAKVTVLEKSKLFGGTSAVSGGGMWLPGNTLDPEYTDDVEGAKRYLMKLTVGLIDEKVIDTFLAESGPISDFMAEHSPLEFTADVGRPDYHAPMDGSSVTSRTVFAKPYEMPRLKDMNDKVRRPGPGGIVPIQHSEEKELAGKGEDAINDLIRERLEKGIALRGLALVGGLIEGCLDAGVEFVNEARAKELIVEDDKVVGVIADVKGKSTEYRADAVVLGSGGFEWNQDLWKAFMGVPWDGPATPPFNEGDGIVMAAKAGAKLANLDKATWIQGRYLGEEYENRDYMRGGLGGGGAGEILVNLKGRRFANENLNYNDIGRILTHFDPHVYEYDNYPAYAVGDKKGLQRAMSKPNMIAGGLIQGKTEDEVPGDGTIVADTLRELAEKLGMDADGLESQVAEWNANLAKTGGDPVYQRGEKPWETHFMPDHNVLGPVEEGPFYAYRVRASVFGTRGGPVINENAQILGWDNTPIPGLYGAGNTVAHPFASAYPGGGGTLGPCVVFGHLAGKHITGQK